MENASSLVHPEALATSRVSTARLQDLRYSMTLSLTLRGDPKCDAILTGCLFFLPLEEGVAWLAGATCGRGVVGGGATAVALSPLGLTVWVGVVLVAAIDPIVIHDPSNTLGVPHDPLSVAHDPLGVVHDPLGVAHDPLGVAHDPLGVTNDPLGVAHDPLGVIHDPLGVTFGPEVTCNCCAGSRVLGLS